MTTVRLRFYRDLNYFIRPGQRYRFFTITILGSPAVKDTVEAAGIPHTEINGIMINKQWVDFSHRLHPHDVIQVYPPFTPNLYPHPALWPAIPPSPAFVLDGHLGKLAKTLRLLGFDCLYRAQFPDKDIVTLAVEQQRIILTRDRGILKYHQVRLGYCLRTTAPIQQVRAVAKRYHLTRCLRPFTRCLKCNGLISMVKPSLVHPLVPPRIRSQQHHFFQCRQCGHVYWQGSHYQAMLNKIDQLHL